MLFPCDAQERDKTAGRLLPPLSEVLHVVDGSRMLRDLATQLADLHFDKVFREVRVPS